MRAAHALGPADEAPWAPGEPAGLWGRLCAALTGRETVEDAEPGDIWEIES